MTIRRFMDTTLHPALYHGHGRRAPFFEGWYYKLVSADESARYAIIPGVQLSGDAHAFVQVLNGLTGEADYHRFPLTDFWAAAHDFEVHIGPNTFTTQGIALDIQRPTGQIRGELRFAGVQPWPVSVLAPGIMGWYAWMPAMECYHGVLSFDHAIEGALTLNGLAHDFSGGRGYIEKDWGQAFPAAWVWFQTNHFPEPAVCLTASVAIIPWIGRAFPGFIIGLWRAGHLYRFATYTGARIEKLRVSDDQVLWAVRNRQHRLEMTATRAAGGLLLGPTREDMGKRVNETLSAAVDVRLSTLAGATLFAGQGRHAGLEAHGDLARLLALLGA